MAIDPLAVSSGIGQGEAQVFKPFQTDYYKYKTAEAKQRRSEANKMMTIDTKDLWRRDVPLMAKGLSELRQFYKDNYRKILKGDPDVQVQLNQKAQQLTNTVSASKQSKAYYNDLFKLWQKNPNSWTKEAPDFLKKYAETPGDFNITGGLTPRLDKDALDKQDKSIITSFTQEQLPIRKGAVGGVEGIFDERRTSDQAIKDYAMQQWQNQSNIFGEKQLLDAYGSYENYEKLKLSQAKEDTKFTQLRESRDGGFGKDTNYGVVVGNSPMNSFSLETSLDKQGIVPQQTQTTSVASFEVPSGFSGSLLSSEDFIPLKPLQIGKEYSADDASKNLVKKDIGANKYNVASIRVLPVYKKGTKGDKTKVDMSGMLVEDEILNNLEKYPNLKGNIEFRTLAFVDPTGKTGVEGYVPVSYVDNIMYTNSKTRGKKWDNTKNKLKEQEAAANKKYGFATSGSSAGSTSEKVGVKPKANKKGIYPKDIEAKIKQLEKSNKGKTREQIISALKKAGKID